jgi:hypothetical protein
VKKAKLAGGEVEKTAGALLVVDDDDDIDADIALLKNAGAPPRSVAGQQRRTDSRLERRRTDDKEPAQKKSSSKGGSGGTFTESNMLLQKLMENLRGNPALQNVNIRDNFKLSQIRGEADLQDYRNLLNAMAALFYTNHRIGTVNQLFYQWRQAALLRQQQNAPKRGGSSAKSGAAGARKTIQIDTELANQEAFKNYHHINNSNVGGKGGKIDEHVLNCMIALDDEPSEIP